MATHFSILAWEIPWTEKPGGLQFMGFQSVKTRLSDEHFQWLLFEQGFYHLTLATSICIKSLFRQFPNFHKMF